MKTLTEEVNTRHMPLSLDLKVIQRSNTSIGEESERQDRNLRKKAC